MYIFIIIDQQLPSDQRSLNYIKQLESKVKELEEEKYKLSKKIVQDDKIEQKINNWNADGSFPVSLFNLNLMDLLFYYLK